MAGQRPFWPGALAARQRPRCPAPAPARKPPEPAACRRPPVAGRAAGRLHRATCRGTVRPLRLVQPAATGAGLAGSGRPRPAGPELRRPGAAGPGQRHPAGQRARHDLGRAAPAQPWRRLRHAVTAGHRPGHRSSPPARRGRWRPTARHRWRTVCRRRPEQGDERDDPDRRRGQPRYPVAVADRLPPPARTAEPAAHRRGTGGRLRRLRTDLRADQRPDPGARCQSDRGGRRLPAALPEQELGPCRVAQLERPAQHPAGPDAEPGHQPDGLPGAGLHAVSGTDPDRRVLRRRVDRRLPVFGMPAACLAERHATATGATPAGAGHAHAELARPPAPGSGHLLVAGAVPGILHRRHLATAQPERPAPVAGQGPGTVRPVPAHRRAHRPTTHQPVLPGACIR